MWNYTKESQSRILGKICDNVVRSFGSPQPKKARHRGAGSTILIHVHYLTMIKALLQHHRVNNHHVAGLLYVYLRGYF